MPATTPAIVKQLDGGTFTPAQDALLTQLVDGAQAFMVSYLGYDPEQQSYIITKNGNGNVRMALDHPRVTEVSRVVIDDVDMPVSTGVGVRGFIFNSDGIVSLRGAAFNRGVMNVRFEYVAGFPAAQYPADLTVAASELVLHKLRTRANIGLQSKTLANETVVYLDKDMPSSVRSVFGFYRRTYLT